MAPKQKPEAKKAKPEAKKAKPEAKKAKPEAKKAKPEAKKAKPEQKPEPKLKKEEAKKGNAKPEAKKAAKPESKLAKIAGKPAKPTPKAAKPEAKVSKDKKGDAKPAQKSKKSKPSHGLGVFIKDLDFPGLDHASVIETFKQFKTSITEVRVRHHRYVMVFLKTADAVSKFLELDGKTVQGCKIQVQAIKRAQPTRPRDEYCKTIYVSRLPGKTTKEHLKNHFKNIGKILKIRIYNKPKVHAFIYFRKNEHALRALKKAKKPYLHGRNYKAMGVPRSQTFRLKAKLSIRTIQLDRIKWVKRYYRAPPSVIRAREKKTLDRQKRRIANLRAAKVPEDTIREKYPNLGKKSLKVRLPWWAAQNPKDRVNPLPYWKKKKLRKEGAEAKPEAAKAKPKPKASKTKAAKPQPKEPKKAKPAPKAAKPQPKAAKPDQKAAKPKPKEAKPAKPEPKSAKAEQKAAKPKPKEAKPQPKAQPKGDAAKPAAKKAQPKPQPKPKK